MLELFTIFIIGPISSEARVIIIAPITHKETYADQYNQNYCC